MASVNKVILLGHLGADPETRYLTSGEAVASLRLATTEFWKDKETGERKEQTEWHRISFFGRQAEICGQYLKKGSQVYIEGALRTRKWQDKESGQERYATEIRGEKMQMLGGRPAPGGGADGDSASAWQKPAATKAHAPAANSDPTDIDGDIPF